MGRSIFVTLLLALCSLTAFAQSPSRVLKQGEKALGGAKAFNAVRSWQRSGTVKRVSDGSTGRYMIQTSLPNQFHESYDLGGFEIERGYNGRSGWVRDSRSGLSTSTGEASTDLQAEASYRNTLWLNYKKDKAKIAPAGTAQIDGKPHNVLTLSTAKGTSIKLYFDAVSGQLNREEIPVGDVTKVIDYSDFRKIGAITQPYQMSVTIGSERLEVTFDQVTPNAQIAKTDFDFPTESGEPLPEIRTLLTQLQENEDKVEQLLDTYSYVQKSTKRELGKDGILREVESETRQLSFYKGRRISRVIEKNGKALSDKDQREADRDAEKQVENIEKEIAKQEKKAAADGPPREGGPRVSVAELLRASNLINPRRERFRGRDVIVFDFEPNPNFDYKNAKSILKFFGKTAGVMWIDEQDKQVARLEAFLADSYNIGGGVLAKLRKGASFTLDQERINDEIWLPSSMDINMSVRVLLVKGISVNQVVRSYDYRKFTTEVKDAKVGDESKPAN